MLGASCSPCCQQSYRCSACCDRGTASSLISRWPQYVRLSIAATYPFSVLGNGHCNQRPPDLSDEVTLTNASSWPNYCGWWEYYSANYNQNGSDGDTRMAARMVVDSPLDGAGNDTGAQCVVSLQFVFSVWRSCVGRWIDVFNFGANNIEPTLWLSGAQTFPISQSSSNPCLAELIGVSRTSSGTSWNGGYTSPAQSVSVNATWQVVSLGNNPLP